MTKYIILIFVAFHLTVVVKETISITVLETGYLVNGLEIPIDIIELRKSLKAKSKQQITINTDVCAGPVELAQVYVILQELGYDTDLVKLNAVGNLREKECEKI